MATALERLIRRHAVLGGIIGAVLVFGGVTLVQQCAERETPPVATGGTE